MLANDRDRVGEVNNVQLPPEQEAIRAKCFHHSGKFVEFRREDVETSIPARFDRILRDDPNRIATKTHHCLCTYADLNTSANKVAHAVLALSTAGQEPVAVLLEHGNDIITAMLGIWKSGKIYVPLDPELPQPTNRSILEESEATLIVTSSRLHRYIQAIGQNHRVILIDEVNENLPPDDLGGSVLPDDLAYILFTSGSTGRPKGIVQNHRNLLNQIRKETNGLHICADDRLILLRSCSAIGGVRIVLSALLNGAAVYPFDVKSGTYPQLAGLVSGEKVTIYDSTPTVFRHFVDVLGDEKQVSDLRLVRLSSEPVRKQDVDLYKKHFPRSCILANSLGLTETTGSIRLNLIDHDTTVTSDTVPVGYAVEETEVALLDERGHEVGPGEIGEIAVRSRYLSLGYWRQPDLTRARFTANSEGGKLTYMTGDLGEMLADGCLMHLGRKDFQVKVRGFKVDIAEIERILLAHESIKEAAVVAHAGENNEQSVVAYLVPATKEAPTISGLRRAFADKLPAYMIPSSFVVLDQLPTTPTGKVDRRALPLPEPKRPQLEVDYVAPRSSTEKVLADIWQQVLHVDEIGIDDNFFDLGGDSVRLVEVSRKIEAVFGRGIALAEMLNLPTIRILAESLDSERKQDAQRKGRDRAGTRKTLMDRRKRSIRGSRA